MREKLRRLPKGPGVYGFFNNNGEVVYVGKAVDLWARVGSYFTLGGDGRAKVELMVGGIEKIGWIEVVSELEALMLEAKLIRDINPKYNSRSKDDKNPLYIVITDEEWPKVRMARKREGLKGEWFGPFSSGIAARKLVKTLRRVVPMCTCKRNIGRPCVYASIGWCDPSPRAVKIMEHETRNTYHKEYMRNVNLFKRLLRGRAKTVIRELEKLMRQAAKEEDYEGASKWRDAVERLKWLVKPMRWPEQFLENPKLAHEERLRAAEELTEELRRGGLDLRFKRLKRIEAYDISGLAGKWITGSMVVFSDGQPDTSEYRRFRIRKQGKIDDTGAMREMLERRFKRKDWELPNLVVVDGGRGQLAVAEKVLKERGVERAAIGLAKKQEEIYLSTSEGVKRLSLPWDSSGLQLVQHIRDEAHRFAKKYHVSLRRGMLKQVQHDTHHGLFKQTLR